MNRLRSLAPGVVPLVIGLVALWYFITVVTAQDPFSHWLVGRYLGVMVLAGLWGLSALCGGFFITEKLKLGALPLRERLVTSFALGLLAWALLIVAVGLLGVLGKTMFFALPLFFFGVGGLPLLKALRRASRLRRHVRARPSRLLDHVFFAFGLICVALIWVNLLTPRNLMYDARWYHLSLAEQFAVSGRVYRLDEGWFNGTMPHLATWLQTWSFLSPFGRLFDRLELAAHLEFVVFLATLASLPVLIDALLPRPRLGSSWALRFLFPGVLLYDSSLGGGADHVLAFWAVPLFLALRRFWRRPTTHGVLFGAFAGAAALTKYQALFLLMGPALAVTVRVFRALLQKSQRSFLRPALVTAAVALAVSSPHWALNALWHHNPVYPYLPNVFPSTPRASSRTSAKRRGSRRAPRRRSWSRRRRPRCASASSHTTGTRFTATGPCSARSSSSRWRCWASAFAGARCWRSGSRRGSPCRSGIGRSIRTATCRPSRRGARSWWPSSSPACGGASCSRGPRWWGWWACSCSTRQTCRRCLRTRR